MTFLRESVWGVYASSLLIAAVIMWIGAFFAGLRNVGFGRALVASFALTVVTWTLSAYLAESLGILGVIVALCITLFMIKSMFETSWESAFVVWAVNALAQFGLAWAGWNHGLLATTLVSHL